MNGPHVGEQFFRRQNRENGGREKRRQADHRGDQSGFHRLTPQCEEAFRRDPARGEKHRVDGSEVIMLSVQENELCESDEICDAKKAVRPTGEQPDKSAEPERERGGIHDEDLLAEELQRAERDVFVAARYIAQELERGPVVADLSDDVR